MMENRQMEFKEKLTDSFLKTVSAYANYEGGVIKFGINDEGKPVGMEDVKGCCEAIENKINDTIVPKPMYYLKVDEDLGVIILMVEAGAAKPYYYRGKAYKRSGTSTVEVDRVELNRLILDGLHQSFDQQISRKQDLEFAFLAQEMRSVGVTLNEDVLRTLNLCDIKGKYNVGALLLADVNQFCGINCVVFGESLDIILDRQQISGQSVLRMFAEGINNFRRNYLYEKIEGQKRFTVERIPEKAFREALANALVHRSWDRDIFIRISMFADRVEIVSPGGLPEGISVEEYLQGKLSSLRNPILANVFFRLGYIEMFGTGVKRIRQLYAGKEKVPIFEVQENSVTVILPVVGESLDLFGDEKIVYECLSKQFYLGSAELVKRTGFKKDKLLRILGRLLTGKYIVKVGRGRGTKYGL